MSGTPQRSGPWVGSRSSVRLRPASSKLARTARQLLPGFGVGPVTMNSGDWIHDLAEVGGASAAAHDDVAVHPKRARAGDTVDVDDVAGCGTGG